MRFSHLASAALAVAGPVAATPRPMDLDILTPRTNEAREVSQLIQDGIAVAKRDLSKSTSFPLKHSWAPNETLVKGSFTKDIAGIEETVDIDVACKECYTLGSVTATVSDHALIKPRIRIEFQDFEAYMDLGVNISSSSTYTKNLFTSETPLGISSDLVTLGIVFYVDLVFSLSAEIDFEAGFYVTMEDGAYIEADLFSDELGSWDLGTMSAKKLPVIVTAGKATFKADLRLRLEVGAEAGLDIIGVGAQVGLYVNLLEFIAELETNEQCALQATEEFDVNAGIFANLDVVVDSKTFGAVPTKSTTLYTFASATQCLIEATSTSVHTAETNSHAITKTSSKGSSQTTEKTTSRAVSGSAFKSTHEAVSSSSYEVTSKTGGHHTTPSASHGTSSTATYVTTKTTHKASSSKTESESTSTSFSRSAHGMTSHRSSRATSKVDAETASESSALYHPSSANQPKPSSATSLATSGAVSRTGSAKSTHRASSKTKPTITASEWSNSTLTTSHSSLVTVTTRSPSGHGRHQNNTSSHAVITTTGATDEGYVTSTLYHTSVHTLVQCAVTVVNCPARYASEIIVTQTIDVYTTVCPATASITPPASWYATATTTAAAATAAATGTGGSGGGERPAFSYVAHAVTDLITLTAVPTPIVNTFCPNPESASPTLTSGPGTTTTVLPSALTYVDAVLPTPTCSVNTYPLSNSTTATLYLATGSISSSSRATKSGGDVTAVYQTTAAPVTTAAVQTSAYKSPATTSVVTAGAGKVVGGMTGLVGVGLALLAFL